MYKILIRNPSKSTLDNLTIRLDRKLKKRIIYRRKERKRIIKINRVIQADLVNSTTRSQQRVGSASSEIGRACPIIKSALLGDY